MSIKPAGYVCSNERIKKAQGDGQSIDLIGQGNQDDKCWSNILERLAQRGPIYLLD